MKVPDWRKVDLDEGVLREATPDDQRIVLWLPVGSDGSFRHWERISNVSGADVTDQHGLCAIAATSIRASQRVRHFFGKLLGRLRKPAGDRTWMLANGEPAEQQGERQTDLVLVWAEDESAPLDEARVRSRWPEGKRFQRIGKNLFLVAGVEPPGVGNGPAPPQGSPREQAEQLLAAARQAGDRRRQALALTDLGVVCRLDGEATRAVALLEEALALAGQLGDRVLEGDVLGNLGLAVLGIGQPARALQLLEQALAYARAAADRFGEKTALELLGNAFASLRAADQAFAFYEQALAIAREVGDRQHEAELLWHQAIQLAELGQRDQAVVKGQAAVDLLGKTNHPHAGRFADVLHRYYTGAANAGLAGPAVTPSMTYGGQIVASSWAPQSGHEFSQGQEAGPGLLRMAFSAMKSMAQFLGSGLKTVSAEAHRKRLRTCAACEHHTGVRCRICGCFTNVKARLPHEHCPIGKWPV